MGYILVVTLVLITAIFVAIEMAVFSVRAERLGIAAAKGDSRGTIVLGYLSDPPKFLSSFQMATTLTSILIGAYGQSYIAEKVTPRFAEAGLASPSTWAFWTTVAGTTFLSLIFANLVPKQIGFVWAEEVSLLSARASRVYVRFTRPLAWILEVTARGIVSLFRIPIASQTKTTEADVVYMIQQGRNAGELDHSEREIAENAFKLSDLRVVDSMTRRDQIVWVDQNWPIERIRQFIVDSGRSFLPLCEGKLDHVVGIIKSRDILALPIKDLTHARLLAEISEPLVIPRKHKLLQVIEHMRSSDSRVAMVADEHGGMVGMLALNDLVAAIVGPLCGIK